MKPGPDPLNHSIDSSQVNVSPFDIQSFRKTLFIFWGANNGNLVKFNDLSAFIRFVQPCTVREKSVKVFITGNGHPTVLQR